MNSKQFSFSLSVGIFLAIFGTALMLEDSIGISLIALGLVITLLSLITRLRQSDNSQHRLQTIAIDSHSQHKQKG
jgi:hypothetical protein